MRETIKVRKADVAEVLARTFPSYRGRTFRVDVAELVTFHDLHWGGGSRNEYRAVRLADGAAGDIPTGPAPWASPTEGLTVPLPPGVVVAEHVMFCGRDLGIRFHVNPATVARMLPPGDVVGVGCATAAEARRVVRQIELDEA